jgi:hypothetical protein
MLDEAAPAQRSGQAVTIGKAWQSKNLSHRDLLFIIGPFDRR